MSKIAGIGAGRWITQTGTAPEKPAPSEKGRLWQKGGTVRQGDSVSLSRPAPAPEELWNKTVEDCAASIRNSFSSVDVVFSGYTSSNDLARQGVALGNGLHILVSRDFLEGMAANEKSYQEGMKTIEEMVKRLSDAYSALGTRGVLSGGLVVDADGTVSVWAHADPRAQQEDSADKFLKAMMEGSLVRHYQEKGGRNVTEIKTQDGTIKLVIVKKLGYSPGKDLARLARLVLQKDVTSFMSGVQGNIARIKASGKGYDEDEIKMALAQMNGVLSRARVKVKKLKEEEVLKRRIHRAQEKKEKDKMLQLARELKKKRTLRKVREYGQIRDQFYPIDLPGKSKYDPDEYQLGPDGGISGALTGAPSSGVVPEGTGGGDIAASLGGSVDILV